MATHPKASLEHPDGAKRTILRWSEIQGWVAAQMKDLTPGQLFVVMEPEGSLVTGLRESPLHRANADPYQVEEGVWGVDADDLPVQIPNLLVSPGALAQVSCPRCGLYWTLPGRELEGKAVMGTVTATHLPEKYYAATMLHWLAVHEIHTKVT